MFDGILRHVHSHQFAESVVMSQNISVLWMAVETFPAGDPVVDPQVTHDVKTYFLKSDADLRSMFPSKEVAWLSPLDILTGEAEDEVDQAFIACLERSQNSEPYMGYDAGDDLKTALEKAFRLGFASIKRRERGGPDESKLDMVLTTAFTHMDEEKITLLEGPFRKRILHLMKKAYMQGQGCACANANMVIRGADSISRLVE